MKRILSLVICLTLLLSFAFTANAANSAKATTIRLGEYTGAVSVTDAAGSSKSTNSKMRLYNGYSVSTGAKSSAYITLDDEKAIKLDANTSVKVKKSGSQFEVFLSSGTLYFNTTAPVKKTGSFKVETSTTVTGIRGSSGWINEKMVALIHGHILVTEKSGKSSGISDYSGIKKRTVALQSGFAVRTVDDGTEESKAVFKLKTGDFTSMVLEEIDTNHDLQKQINEDGNFSAEELIASIPEVKAAEEAAREQAQTDIDKATEEDKEALIEAIAEVTGTGEGSGDTPVIYAPVTEETDSSGQDDGGNGTGGNGGSTDDLTLYFPTGDNFTIDNLTVGGLSVEVSEEVTVASGSAVSFDVYPSEENSAFTSDFTVETEAGSDLEMTWEGSVCTCTFTMTESGSVTVSGADLLMHIVQNDEDDMAASFGGDYGSMIVVESPLSIPEELGSKTIVLSGITMLVRDEGSFENCVGFELMGGSAIATESASFELPSVTVGEECAFVIDKGSTVTVSRIEDEGTVMVGTSSSLSFTSLTGSGALSNMGTITTGTEGSLEIGTLANAGGLSMENSYITVTDSFSNSGSLAASSINVHGTFANSENCQVSVEALSIGDPEVGQGTGSNDPSFTNLGTVNCTSYLAVYEGATVNNAGNTAQFMISGESEIMGTFNNGGTVTVNANASLYIAEIGSFENNGTVENDGEIVILGSFTGEDNVTGDGTIQHGN